ncbi:MAG: hypothetical protein ACE5OR_10510 [bacterium]
MGRVKFFSLFALCLVFVLVLALWAFSQEKKGQMKGQKMLTPAQQQAELAKVVEKGKALFYDKELGTSGMTCNSCHLEGGTKTNPMKMKGMTMDAFDNLGAQYPKYFPMAMKVMTLDQVINFCVVNPLKGKPLTLDDPKLTALTTYVASIKGEEKGEKEKK